MGEHLKEMKTKVNKTIKMMNGKTHAVMDDLVHKTYLPFTPNVMRCPLLPKFKIPQLVAIDDTKDPLDHLRPRKC